MRIRSRPVTVNSISAQHIEYKQHAQIVNDERRREAALQEQRHDKLVKEDNEQKRVEANQRMNRAGQNVDKLA